MMRTDRPGNDGDGQNDTTNWAALLAGGDDRPPWIALTPERIAYLSLHDCLIQLELAVIEFDRLAFAVKSAHMALQAALTAALAGTATLADLRPASARPFKLQWTSAPACAANGNGPAVSAAAHADVEEKSLKYNV